MKLSTESYSLIMSCLEQAQEFADAEDESRIEQAIKEVQEGDEHNGWSNYETWRVNLEIVSNIPWSKDENTFATTRDLETYIHDYVEQLVFEDTEPSLVYDFANAFMSDVNFAEIALAVAKDYPFLITGVNTQGGEAITE